MWCVVDVWCVCVCVCVSSRVVKIVAFFLSFPLYLSLYGEDGNDGWEFCWRPMILFWNMYTASLHPVLR